MHHHSFNFQGTYCVVPENIHAHPKEGLRKFQGGGGFQKPNFLNESMTLKWNFRRGGGFNLIFSVTTHSQDLGMEQKDPFNPSEWVASPL